LHFDFYMGGVALRLRERDIAWCLALSLTRVSGNGFGLEGARALSAPLGQLTALQQLDLGGNICILIFIWAGLRCG
jgi:hypothetical protein